MTGGFEGGRKTKNSTDMVPALGSVVCGGITPLYFVFVFETLLKFSYSKNTDFFSNTLNSIFSPGK